MTGDYPFGDLRLPHGHAEPLDLVVGEALEVPRRLQRLDVAGGVGGARADDVLARGRVPVERPAAPGALAAPLAERRVVPCGAAVDAHLDALDRRPAGPCAALEPARPGV